MVEYSYIMSHYVYVMHLDVVFRIDGDLRYETLEAKRSSARNTSGLHYKKLVLYDTIWHIAIDLPSFNVTSNSRSSSSNNNNNNNNVIYYSCHPYREYYIMNQEWVKEYHRCYITQYMLHTKLNSATGDWFCWPTQLECIHCIPWRRHFKGWNVMELCVMLI